MKWHCNNCGFDNIDSVLACDDCHTVRELAQSMLGRFSGLRRDGLPTPTEPEVVATFLEGYSDFVTDEPLRKSMRETAEKLRAWGVKRKEVDAKAMQS